MKRYINKNINPERVSLVSQNIFIEHNDLLIEYLEDEYTKVYDFKLFPFPKITLRKKIRGQHNNYINYLNKMIKIPKTYHDKPKMKWQKLKQSDNQKTSLKELKAS